MRLVFSSSDYRDADLADEQGHILYTIRTTSPVSPKTTIKRRSNGLFGESQVVAVIHWHTFRSTEIHFRKGRTISADDLLTKRWFSSDRHFVGPDGQGYKWRLHSLSHNCVLQPEDSYVELVKYHKQTSGCLSHPPYLEISPSVTHMLDCVITTFVYVESLSQQQHAAVAGQMGNMYCTR